MKFIHAFLMSEVIRCLLEKILKGILNSFTANGILT